MQINCINDIIYFLKTGNLSTRLMLLIKRNLCINVMLLVRYCTNDINSMRYNGTQLISRITYSYRVTLIKLLNGSYVSYMPADLADQWQLAFIYVRDTANQVM